MAHSALSIYIYFNRRKLLNFVTGVVIFLVLRCSDLRGLLLCSYL